MSWIDYPAYSMAWLPTKYINKWTLSWKWRSWRP